MKRVVLFFVAVAISTQLFGGVIDLCPNLETMQGEPPQVLTDMAFHDTLGWGIYEDHAAIEHPAEIICERYGSPFSTPTEWLCVCEDVPVNVQLEPDCWPDIITVRFNSFFCDGDEIPVEAEYQAIWNEEMHAYYLQTVFDIGTLTVKVQRRILNAYVLISFIADNASNSFVYLFRVKLFRTGCYTNISNF